MTLIPDEKAIIEGKLNVMLMGPTGTGKSACIRGLADRFNLKIAIFNGATMDPFTNLIGLPMPRQVAVEDGSFREVLKMIRPIAIDDADLIFIDELNRASVETQNACMELCNERTINGEPLPKLKCVFTAINPPDSGNHNVGLIDDAMTERWHQYYDITPTVDPDILVQFDGISRPVAEALATWYKECDHAKRDSYISPRKVAHFGKVFELSKNKKMLYAALTPGATADMGKLFAMLMEATGKPVKGLQKDKALASTAPEASDESAAIAPTGTPGSGSGSLSWFTAKHGNSPRILKRLSKDHTVEEINERCMQWAQASRSRFRTAVRHLLEEGHAFAPHILPIVAAINSDNYTPQNSVKIRVPASAS